MRNKFLLLLGIVGLQSLLAQQAVSEPLFVNKDVAACGPDAVTSSAPQIFDLAEQAVRASEPPQAGVWLNFKGRCNDILNGDPDQPALNVSKVRWAYLNAYRLPPDSAPNLELVPAVCAIDSPRIENVKIQNQCLRALCEQANPKNNTGGFQLPVVLKWSTHFALLNSVRPEYAKFLKEKAFWASEGVGQEVVEVIPFTIPEPTQDCDSSCAIQKLLASQMIGVSQRNGGDSKGTLELLNSDSAFASLFNRLKSLYEEKDFQGRTLGFNNPKLQKHTSEKQLLISFPALAELLDPSQKITDFQSQALALGFSASEYFRNIEWFQQEKSQANQQTRIAAYSASLKNYYQHALRQKAKLSPYARYNAEQEKSLAQTAYQSFAVKPGDETQRIKLTLGRLKEGDCNNPALVHQQLQTSFNQLYKLSAPQIEALNSTLKGIYFGSAEEIKKECLYAMKYNSRQYVLVMSKENYKAFQAFRDHIAQKTQIAEAAPLLDSGDFSKKDQIVYQSVRTILLPKNLLNRTAAQLSALTDDELNRMIYTPLCQSYNINSEVNCARAINQFEVLAYYTDLVKRNITRHALKGRNTFSDQCEDCFGHFIKVEGESLKLSLAIPNEEDLRKGFYAFKQSKRFKLPPVDVTVSDQLRDGFDTLGVVIATQGIGDQERKAQIQQLLAEITPLSSVRYKEDQIRGSALPIYNDGRIAGMLQNRDQYLRERDQRSILGLRRNQSFKDVSFGSQVAFGISSALTSTGVEFQSLVGIAAQWLSDFVECKACGDFAERESRLAQHTLSTLQSPAVWGATDNDSWVACAATPSCISKSITSFAIMLLEGHAIGGAAQKLLPSVAKLRGSLGGLTVTGQGAMTGVAFSAQTAIQLKGRIEESLKRQGLGGGEAASIASKLALLAGAINVVTNTVGLTNTLFNNNMASLAGFKAHLQGNAFQTYTGGILNSVITSMGENQDLPLAEVADRAMINMVNELKAMTGEFGKMALYGGLQSAKARTTMMSKKAAVAFREFMNTHPPQELVRQARAQVAAVVGGGDLTGQDMILNNQHRVRIVSSGKNHHTAVLLDETGQPFREADGTLTVFSNVKSALLQTNPKFNFFAVEPSLNLKPAKMTPEALMALNPNALLESKPIFSLSELSQMGRALRNPRTPVETITNIFSQLADVELSIAQRAMLMGSNDTPASLVAYGMAHSNPQVRAQALQTMLRSNDGAVRRLLPELLANAIRRNDFDTIAALSNAFSDARNVTAFRVKDLDLVFKTLNQFASHPNFRSNSDLNHTLLLGLVRLMETPEMKIAFTQASTDTTRSKILNSPAVSLIKEALGSNPVAILQLPHERIIGRLKKLVTEETPLSERRLLENALAELETHIKERIRQRLDTEEAVRSRMREAANACGLNNPGLFSIASNKTAPLFQTEIASLAPKKPTDLQEIEWLFGLATDPAGS